ncbi:MAG: hypothetical protein JWM82_1221, partial [Myxococcales bacterium]|nr:hypothetical protein [Myxococcales bacterium]
MTTEARGVSKNRSLLIRVAPLATSAIVLWSAAAAAQAPAAPEVGGPAGT